MDDRRRFFRVAFQSVADLADGSGTIFPVELLDISLRGALLRCTSPQCPVAGREVTLTLHLDDADAIVMRALVAHVESGRIGLTCRELDLESATHLRRLVELNLGNEDLLERELSALLDD